MNTALRSRLAPCAVTSFTVGSVPQYITAVYALPMLSEQQEQELAERLRKSGDLDAAHKLILAHLRLVVSVARGYSGYGLPQSDLIQEGNIGLMKAVRHFDPARGVRLASFAMKWIRAHIHEFVVRNWRLVKIATTKAQRKLFFNLRSLNQHGTPLDTARTEAIARQLGVCARDVAEMEVRFGAEEVALQNWQADETHGCDPIGYLRADRAEPDALLEERQNETRRAKGLQRALELLDSRSRRIVEARWLSEKPSTLQRLAGQLGISAERVRQIEKQALVRMREAIGAAELSVSRP